MSGPVKVVVALGGNALEDKSLPPTAASQLQVAGRTAEQLAQLSCAGYELAIVHGNGPQVGRILLASETAEAVTPPMPFDVCGAMSQGYIGYDLQNGIREELLNRGIYRTVSTVLTQVIVDPYDEAFYTPTKVLGRYMNAQEANEERKKGNYVIEEPGKGFRRVVSAPNPVKIVELDAVKALLDANQVVIAAGGGGIPVLEQDNHLRGASAVIEKDLAAGKLAEGIDAEMLIILTNVEKVCINLGQKDEEPLGEITTEQAKTYMEEGHFGIYNMLPKFRASVDFVEECEGRSAYITSFDKVTDALKGKTGTVIR